MNKLKNLLTITALATLLVGCASGTHITTGKKRPPLKTEDVILYQVQPAKFEFVGIVNAHSSGKGQMSMDASVEKLKAHAAKMGANGILIGNVDPGRETTSAGFASGSALATSGGSYGSAVGGGSSFGATSSGIYLSGRAIYVEP